MAKESLLIIYKEDFRKTSVWVDICTILEIPTDSESAYITFTNVQHEIDDFVNCEKCTLAKNINVSKMYPSDSGEYICNSCLNDLYDYSAE